MLPESGFIALLLACGVSAAMALALFPGLRILQRLVSHWALLQFGLLAFAFGALTLSFLQDDFSVVYVAQHSHRALPLLLKTAAVWGGHEGSLLLWVLLLCGWSALFAWRYRKDTDALFPLTQALLACITFALLIFIVCFSDPFVRIFPPAVEGRDLNPMLQHIGLILHPPLLYLGYGGLTVSAAIAQAALLRGGFSAPVAWICWRWALPAWCALTLGIILGSWWAYSELGWGGWWFWDPVENASLLPWLTASALLHSLYVTRMRGIFRHWSLLLAIITFILALLGTLIVRSGILVSVHAFALDNVRAVPMFALFALLSIGALALYAWRAQAWQAAARFDWRSREMALLVTLLLFGAVTLIVLVGTLYPMLYSLSGWGRISVGAPYFNSALLPFGLLMLLLLGLSAGGGWKTAMSQARWQSVGALVIGLAAGLALSAWGIAPALAGALAGWAAARWWCQPGQRLRRRLPGALAHSGVALFALGIALSSVSKEEVSVNLSPGESVALAGYRFEFQSLQLMARDNYTTELATIAVRRGDKPIRQLTAERRFYGARNQQMMEPGVAWGLVNDWYTVMGEKTGENRYAMRFYVQSGVRWIWGGGLLMIVGALSGWWRGRGVYG
ncbi:heme lyase CcmF/NrfE family subunit [Entomohabitans teleogrylli]|uniref:heme lyase CcmF/NrfE family subunit n=1 Tax=Entomohabitans teleogrylli TaxID=1384589 RepID=UPI0008FC442C|nr:heme lyase CcmF/NrfE family subunit [Entomohabitans teleogrylli]